MILAFLASRYGQAAVICVVISVAFGVWLARHDAKVANRVETKIVQRSEAYGRQRSANADKAHTAARKPGAADRLRSDPAACPDCNRQPVQKLETANRQPK